MRMPIRRWSMLLVCLLAASSLALGGCAALDNNPLGGNLDSTPTEQLVSQANETMNDLPRLEGKATVVMTVNDADITIELDGENAPVTAGNFVDLVDRGFYDNLTFHRVVKQPQPFVVQGGDPLGNGTGGFVDPDTDKARYIPLEIKPEGAEEPVYGSTLKQAGTNQPPVLPHSRGAVSMARSQMPNSASSQFFFALADLPFLDGDYAVFGYITQGVDAIDNIQQGDRIQAAKVVSGLDNLKR